MVRLALMPSSAVTSPRPVSTGTISSASRPASRAAAAFWWLASANSSCMSRVTPYLAATFSAVSPSVTGGYSSFIAGLTSRQPSRVSATPAARAHGSAARGRTNGALVIDSEPPARQMSASPAAIARAALAIASRPEPQRRLTVAPGTVTGSPASRTAIRPALRLSSPAWLAAPQYTSSMADGSSQGFRRTRAATMPAARWSGRTPASAPLIRPIGVRQASTAKTALIGSSSPHDRYGSRSALGLRLPAPGLDEGGQGGQRGQRIEVEVLRGDVHPVPPVHLAQQQRAGQRVQPDARPEQRKIEIRRLQLRPPGQPRQQVPQLPGQPRVSPHRPPRQVLRAVGRPPAAGPAPPRVLPRWPGNRPRPAPAAAGRSAGSGWRGWPARRPRPWPRPR